MPTFAPFTVTAFRAAQAAAEIQRGLFGRLNRIDYKGRHDPVTEADRASEQAIVRILREAFPDHAFLGEEGGRQGTAPYTWLIDPLDGTLNYPRAFPRFPVSIALEDRDRLISGVILEPVLGEVYAAEDGGGAYAAATRDLPPDAAGWGDLTLWRRLSVSGTRRLDEAILTTAFPASVSETRLNVDHFLNLLLAGAKIRNTGSAALNFAAVAQGQIDGYWEIGPRAWDFAAGALLVQEAGGRVSDLRGRPASVHGGQILATNGGIHDEVVMILARGQSGLE